jgi:tetratricopeptide (TPR) repeat protein
MPVRIFACFLLCAAALFASEAPFQPSAPFPGQDSAGSSVSLGSATESLAAANRALALGFPSIAAELYKSVLEQGAASGDGSKLRLAYVTALMEDGKLEQARKVLQDSVGVRGSAWHLRAGLIAVQSRQFDQARGELNQVKAEDLEPTDKSWHFYLQGLLADASGNFKQGGEAYDRAIEAGQTELAKVRFKLALREALLKRGVSNLDQQRATVERFQGMVVGHEASLQYAVGLHAAGRKAEAVAVLQRLLISLPASELQFIDKVRLFLGLIDGVSTGSTGRNALLRLLETGQDAESQQIALHLLARGPGGDDFRAKLDQLIALPNPHRILESLFLYRAELSLLAKDFAQAEADARALLDRFPGSQLRVQALGILTGSAWEQRRYRLAADNAEKARQELPQGPARARLGLLVAEAWYRAGDYASAADAYGAVLRDIPPGVSPGLLMFQRVLAEIDAGRLKEVPDMLDELSRNPAFDPDNRWQAEWNLARALQDAGRAADAYARVNKLLQSAPQASDMELRARMAWLQMHLALESGQNEEAIRLVSGISAYLEKIPQGLRFEIASSAALAKARALISLNRSTEALAALQRLRSDYPGGAAAVYSIVIEADYNAAQGRTADARQLLLQVADQYKDSPYAAYALFRACLLAEQGGQDKDFEEANQRIEELVTRYPRSDLVFYARLKQGDLLRKLNQFAPAEQGYDALIKMFPDHKDVLAARMALADCHSAQASSDPARIDRALEIYEALVARPDASADLRVEAGYKLGLAHVRRGEQRRAIEVWWRDVVAEFLEKPDHAALLGAKGRYWMGRVLRDLGAQLEQQSRNDEARRAWTLLVEFHLPGAAYARARLGLPSEVTATKP